MKKVTKEMKIRRYNELLFAKCVRIGDRETAAWFRARLIKTPDYFINVRALAKLYHSARATTEYGYEMSSMMDGSGECGKFIYGHYDEDLRDDIVQACEKSKVSYKDAMNAVTEILNTIYMEMNKWCPNAIQTRRLYDEEQYWDHLITALGMALDPEKEYLPY